MKHISFDIITEHVRAIPINGPLFSGLLDATPIEVLERLGTELGPKLIKQTFVFLDLDFDINGLIQHYFEPMSSFSGWYEFRLVVTEKNRKLMFKHSHGPKWSSFLRAYISSMIRAATGTELRIITDEELVTVYC
jgi:hypothetical protein